MNNKTDTKKEQIKIELTECELLYLFDGLKWLVDSRKAKEREIETIEALFLKIQKQSELERLIENPLADEYMEILNEKTF